ncbi:DNA recombination protein RmuC [Roseivivax jejudonensis]|uniref:DNA recombination protein RmuC homolog n=1 Tax=Roseivivax jejudonensis TaxID=1529041 RepID=A0A1X6ZUI4_9RHOB|nr:DNA recombination protein RmuC [Roseivivax jejudonensis]SLN61377.1 DNA recombination protein RmuC [Roseivivax jejudonensis]
MIDTLSAKLAAGDPLALAGLVACAALVLLVLLLLALIARTGRAARTTETLAYHLGRMGQDVRGLAQGQTQLSGSLQTVSETAAQSQMHVLHTVETRLAEVQRQMGERLADSQLRQARSMADMQEKMNEVLAGQAQKTATSLTQLQERLATIDKAQDNITKLSGDVLSLQDILSNKQTRGAFGEIQLTDIVGKALPSDSYTLQATLSNGRRADCLIHLPNPPGPIAVDSKFPLEAFEALRRVETQDQATRAAQAFRLSVKKHIRDIAERYILEGETADGAILFLPSEAVYAELHSNFPELVREGFAARVWIVSPTTCMATLNTMRAILKDARMREQAGAIRKELGLLYADVDRLGARVENLDRHFGQAQKDISEIRISAEKAGRRARRLDNFDFEELSGEPADTRALTGTE